ncbi:MAG TPA: PAS domain S-box protein [Burkholderiaceae bacterium]|nr:PAS domain S-box protein [Burkholderiaceae bacterium]HMX09789.1 PAS domain S-box protein [Burkholderiaceae bacterium]HMY98099.1 PAS domain S-box protein [Burkholderiaceae bacterium]HNB42683.1 PAS domain S-box protein [Burkholderiaceae bacterium]HNG78179.1 PAS domain S-box protein [Burkholderiaceae bacterium]
MPPANAPSPSESAASPTGGNEVPGLLALVTPVATVLGPEASLDEALERLLASPDGVLLVVQDDRPVGILTLRDVARLYAQRVDPAGRRLAEVMSQPVRSLAADIAPAQALAVLRAHAVRQLAVLDEAGRLIGLVGADALLRAQALERQHTEGLVERTRQRAVLDAIPDLVWLKDPQGVYLACNPRFERFFGADEAAILGKTDYDFVPRELADLFRANDRRAMERDAPSVNEEEITFANDGHRELIHTIKTPVRDPDGHLLGVLGIGRDITALRRVEDEYRYLFARNPAPMLIYALDDLALLTVNEAFTQLYGHSAEQAGGLQLTDLFAQDDRAELVQLVHGLRGRHGLVNTGEWRHLKRDGTRLHIVARSHDIVHDDRDCRLVVITDITPLQQGRERDRRQLAMLENLARGESLQRLLAQLTRDYEATFPGSLCSVLLLRDDGLHVSVGAAPSLPAIFNTAIEGQPIGPTAGSCGAAMHLRRRVIVEDIEQHPNWALYRAVAQAANLGSCWSEPIIAAEGQVLGSFAVYHAAPCPPSDAELAYMSYSVQLASLAITHSQTLQRLGESERRTRDVLHALPDPVWLKDEQGVFLACNQRFSQLLGRPVGAIVGRRDHEILPPELWANLASADTTVRASGRDFAFEQWLTSATDGHRGLYEIIKSPLYDEAGRTQGILGVARDITLIKQGAQAIAEQERLVDTMFGQTTDAVTLADPVTLRFVSFNEAAHRGLGYTREQFAELRPQDIQIEHSSDQIVGNVRRALAGETPSFETRHRRADGSVQIAQVTLKRLTFSGRPLLSVVWRDITEAKAHEARIQRLNQAYAVLSGVNEAIARLRDAAVLFAEACRIAVHDGGLHLAWIGRLTEDGRALLPVAHAGAGEDYVRNLHITLPEPAGPTARAMLTGKPVVVDDVHTDPSMQPWRSQALAHGYQSSAAFPISVAGRAQGCLNLYAAEAGHFDADQVGLYGRLAQNLGFALDLIAAERAQHKAQMLRDTLIESVAGIFFAIDREGRLVQWNRRVEELTGFRGEDLRRLPLLGHFAEADRARVSEGLARGFAQGEARLEAELLTHDGRQLPYLFVGRRLDTDPEPLLVGTGVDIGERVRAEQELRTYRQHLEDLVATRTEQLEALNRRLHREDERLRALLALSQQANQRDEASLWQGGLTVALRLTESHSGCVLACSSDGPQPQPLAQAGHANREPPCCPWWRLAQQACASGTVGLSPADERDAAIAVPILEDGHPILLLCVAGKAGGYDRDDERELALVGADLWSIVQRRRTEIELHRAKLAADAASQAKSAFLANMSHEIRTPMNAVVGFAHLLRRDPLTPRQLDHLDKITAASDHLLEVINDILDFSKIEANKVDLQREHFDLPASLARIADMMQSRLRHKAVALHVEVAPGTPRRVAGDRLRLEQVLLNLAGNAVKFTEHGQVTLAVQPVPGDGAPLRLAFEVRDTGIGIGEREIGRLFEAFEQADVSTTRRYGGTGLGLAISRRLVELMGGRIEVHSRLGEGSTFRFELPLEAAADDEPDARPSGPALSPVPLPKATAVAASDEPTATSEPVHAGPAPLLGARILLVEDNPINQEVACDLLHSLGCLVVVAADGAAALHKVENGSFDLVLMDVQMPVMDGLEATTAIRRLPGRARLPIVAMTANAFAEDRRRCLTAGMNDFLIKPVEPAALRQCLLHWLAAGPVGTSVPSAIASPVALPVAPAAAATRPASTGDRADSRAVRAALEHLRNLLTLHDTEAIDAFAQAQALLWAARGEAAGELGRLLRGFDFEAALQRVQAWLDETPSG